MFREDDIAMRSKVVTISISILRIFGNLTVEVIVLYTLSIPICFLLTCVIVGLNFFSDKNFVVLL
ncbi:MAG: hypothetical protein P857_842 [Candidatus Xenolissoclinum pacificiensis L6]|uniref:Uncharacterized protein n=1 Tax=Candidatus Xenolissoclinum pacificiensis L6 TaxID=1401685 RepID=W2V1Z4_9RICK|nr:MAG: hypothetical protein P857_842 [Candidatus Xenolissoclinum pacificiensis L6]